MPDDDLSERPSPSLWRVPLLVFLVALLVTGALTIYLARWIERGERAAFVAEVGRTVDAVRLRTDSAVTLLRGAAGLMAASRTVTRSEFAAYVDRLRLRELYPGIQGIGFTRQVGRGDEARLTAEMRAQGAEGFHLWPEGVRDERHAILFLEPLDLRNRAAIGFDMSTEPTRRAAMHAARDDAEARASGRVTLVQEIDAEKQSGLLIYAPVYDTERAPPTVPARRAHLVGFVYSPLRVGDLLRGVVGPRRVDFEVFDGDAADRALLIYSTRDGASGEPRFVEDRHLDVAGRRWTVRFGNRADVPSQLDLVPGLAALALGASLLLGGISWVQVQARRAAEAAAEERRRSEAALRDSEERERVRSDRLQQLAEAAPRLQAAASVDALVISLEAEARRLVDAPDARVSLGARPAAGDGLVLPLPGDDHEAGWLQVAAREGSAFTDNDRLLLAQLAGLAAIALRNLRLLEAMREADRRKDEFLATLAHELRNPLAPIRTSLELMRRAPGTERAAQARDIADRQTLHMVRLIDDLLDVARISRGTITLQREPTPLAEILGAAVETSRPTIDARAHRLEIGRIDEAWRVDADATRLAQVFANLLNNAAHYTPPGGHISVDASEAGDSLKVSVRDTGIGIAPQVLPRVFDMFTRGETDPERRGGLGIGLTLVRRLVELHGGSVEARSAGPGAGSEFIVTLPKADATGVRPPSETPEPPRAAPLRVLVVDDNRDAADTTAQMLQIDGHAVAVSHNGRDALSLAQEFDPDVVLLDIGLPGINGYEVAKRLRRLRRERPLHLIAITGWGQAEDRRLAEMAGFDLHLVKPVDPIELMGRIAALARQ